MLVGDRVISDSLHELRNRKKRRGKCLGIQLGATLEPDKLPKGLSGVINYHPGKGLGLVTYSKDRQTSHLYFHYRNNLNGAHGLSLPARYPLIMLTRFFETGAAKTYIYVIRGRHHNYVDFGQINQKVCSVTASVI